MFLEWIVVNGFGLFLLIIGLYEVDLVVVVDVVKF